MRLSRKCDVFEEHIFRKEIQLFFLFIYFKIFNKVFKVKILSKKNINYCYCDYLFIVVIFCEKIIEIVKMHHNEKAINLRKE